MSEVQAGPVPALRVVSHHDGGPAPHTLIEAPAPSEPGVSQAPPGGSPAAPTSTTNGSSDHIDRAEGSVKWFDPRKGFGFVVGPAGQDVFVHFSVIRGDGFKALKDNSKVEYDAILADGRWKATRVVRLDGNDDGPEIHVLPRRANPAPRSPRR